MSNEIYNPIPKDIIIVLSIRGGTLGESVSPQSVSQSVISPFRVPPRAHYTTGSRSDAVRLRRSRPGPTTPTTDRWRSDHCLRPADRKPNSVPFRETERHNHVHEHRSDGPRADSDIL